MQIYIYICVCVCVCVCVYRYTWPFLDVIIFYTIWIMRNMDVLYTVPDKASFLKLDPRTGDGWPAISSSRRWRRATWIACKFKQLNWWWDLRGQRLGDFQGLFYVRGMYLTWPYTWRFTWEIVPKHIPKWVSMRLIPFAHVLRPFFLAASTCMST